MWFNDEFYRLADELAAEVERLKERWREEIVRRPLRLFRFRDLDLPAGANINAISFQAYVPANGWRQWAAVNTTWSADGQYALVEVEGNGEPLPPANGALSVVVNRDDWNYGEWYEVDYE